MKLPSNIQVRDLTLENAEIAAARITELLRSRYHCKTYVETIKTTIDGKSNSKIKIITEYEGIVTVNEYMPITLSTLRPFVLNSIAGEIGINMLKQASDAFKQSYNNKVKDKSKKVPIT